MDPSLIPTRLEGLVQALNEVPILAGIGKARACTALLVLSDLLRWVRVRLDATLTRS